MAPSVAARLMRRARAPREEALSGRELAVLRLVARGESNEAIAARLGIGEAAVKAHLLHLLGKLGVDDRTAAVRRGLLDLSAPEGPREPEEPG